jgi:1-acyl-sn-glycerol-3-phosphate acyltransferase
MPLRLIKAVLILLHILAGWLLAALLFYPARIWNIERAGRWLVIVRQRWCALALLILGVRIHAVGRACQAPGILWVGNHVSWLDILVLGSVLPVTFLSKSEVGSWPIIGSLARMAGIVFIRRGAGHGVSSLMAEALARGQSLVLFPEGTTTDGLRVAVFHARLFDTVIRHDFPVHTFCLYYPRAVSDRIAFIGDDEFIDHLWSVLGLRNIDVTLVTGPMLETNDLSRKALAQSAWQLVATQLKEQQYKHEYAAQ